MSSGIILNDIVDRTYERLGGRVSRNEIRRSMDMIAGRWYSVLSIADKWKVAEEIGGSRYVATTFEILDAVFTELVDRSGEEQK